ncbi:hypothetical protein K9L67_01955 [Candidatus Woesearchaeota archaeon]|nr:hypothetical protein [Candidatus Woesearchaeota archaeon]MCF8013317.1 hypothetical protein [Candidatus Woesearchaeota archaeon]
MAGSVNIDFSELFDKLKEFLESMNQTQIIGSVLVGLGLILLIIGAILW